MRHLFLITCLALFLPVAAVAQPKVPPPAADGFTVSDLVGNCMKCSADPKSSECTFCDGILTGTVSTLNMLEGGKSFCPPDNLDTYRARNMFRLWARNNPNDNTSPAVWGVLAAMTEAYACSR